jgi:hypothetical protein
MLSKLDKGLGLDLVLEYQTLVQKERTLDIPLDSVDRARLLGLERLLKGQYLGQHAGVNGTRLVEPLPVQFTVPGGFRSGELRNVSAGGMAIVTDQAPVLKMRTIVRVTDPDRAAEYVFPGRVVWLSGRVVGVAFDGLPTRALTPAAQSTWRSYVRFGAKATTPLVA